MTRRSALTAYSRGEEWLESGVDKFESWDDLPGSPVPLVAFSEGKKYCCESLVAFRIR
jgi:hypothetical protein